MALKPVLVEPPLLYPVTLEEARLFCRIDSTQEDPVVNTMIAAATGYCDGYTGTLNRALITQTWQQPVAAFPASPSTQIRLELTPVQAIEEVAYYDAAGAVVIMDPASYALYTDQSGAYVTLGPGSNWPPTYVRDDAVQIRYVAGYGDTPADVPEPLRQAILFIVRAWYDADGGATGMSPAAARLLSPYRPVIW